MRDLNKAYDALKGDYETAEKAWEAARADYVLYTEDKAELAYQADLNAQKAILAGKGGLEGITMSLGSTVIS